MSTVSAIIVTRGNVDLDPIVEKLGKCPSVDEIIVWRNGQRVERRWSHPLGSFAALALAENLSVYGRYAAIKYAKHDLIYVQDDDCLVDAEGLVFASDSETSEYGGLVCNMPTSRWPDYPDSALVGWGAVFQRDLPELAFERFYAARETVDKELFHRECDSVFTALTPHRKIDIGFQHLPWAEGPDRMWTADRQLHKIERGLMIAMALQARDA